jgi:uncharacterized membrane-anchored protein
VQLIGASGSALLGLGVICAVAAHWSGWSPVRQAATLAAALLAAGLTTAATNGPVRRAAGLLAFILAGALFATIGQRYQTGADPWQLFAVWAVLTLPLAVAVAHDLVWTPWVAVAFTGITAWVHTHSAHRFRVEPQDLLPQLAGWLAALAVVALLAGPLHRRAGAGAASRRLAVVLATLLVGGTALGGLFATRLGLQYGAGLALLALAAAWFWRPAVFDLVALCTVVLALDTLLVVGLARWWFAAIDGDPFWAVLGLTLASTLLLTVSVKRVLARARQAGIGPASTAGPPPAETAATADARPWPVLLLIGLGGWLAAVPMLLAVALLLGALINTGPGTYVAALLCVGSAAGVLRRPSTGLFMEQLMLPLLVAGLVLLGFGLVRDLTHPVALVVLAVAVVAVAVAVPGRVLRAMLGAVATLLLMGALAWWWAPAGAAAGPQAWLLRGWLASHAGAALVAGCLWWQDSRVEPSRAAALEPLLAGAAAAVLPTLALQAGAAVLAPGIAPGLGWLAAEGIGVSAGLPTVVMASSAALAMGAAAVLWRRWPTARGLPLAAASTVLVLLSAALPTLGAAVALTAQALLTGRRGRAALGAVAIGWIVSASYYALAWTLLQKALGLGLAGALLLAVAVFARRGRGVAHSRARTALTASPRAAALPLLTVLAVCGLAAHTVWRYEQLLAAGRPSLVALAPVDPRSLVQGDYMTLAWQLPDDVRRVLDETATTQRPRVAATRDGQDVLTVRRLLASGEPPGPGEEVLELSPKGGRWVIVTDAWFFREGEADRWAAARFGEFRLMPDGRALLVGLRDGDRRPL